MPTLLTPDQLRSIMPRCNVDVWHPLLSSAMPEHGITTPARVCSFLAQIAHESDECNDLEEGLSYSVEGLMRTWPSRFRTTEEAQPYARNPEALANRVYAGRMGNGSVESGDGWLYRGRGLIQVTGKANYEEAGVALGIDLLTDPDQLANPGPPAARVSCSWWERNGCNALTDACMLTMTRETVGSAFRALTKKVNPGLLGLDKRLDYWCAGKDVLR